MKILEMEQQKLANLKVRTDKLRRAISNKMFDISQLGDDDDTARNAVKVSLDALHKECAGIQMVTLIALIALIQYC